MFFNESWYDLKGSLIKCNPSIKTREDQEALIAALKEDRIDIIATDHAPHTLEEKQAGYTKAPAGLPLAQHSLLIGLELVQSGELDAPGLVKKMCHAPALRFGVKDPGLSAWKAISRTWFGYRSKNTPKSTRSQSMRDVAGHLLPECGFVRAYVRTWVNGACAWSEAGFAPTGGARKLEFA